MTDLTLDALRGLTGKELTKVLKREAEMIRGSCKREKERLEPSFVKVLPAPPLGRDLRAEEL